MLFGPYCKLVLFGTIEETCWLHGGEMCIWESHKHDVGDSCVETAKNFVQHVNKTIELNYEVLGLSAGASVVAYLDPYQSTEEFARVLLYDVAHDREFIAFQDLWMQVQSSPATRASFIDAPLLHSLKTRHQDTAAS